MNMVKRWLNSKVINHHLLSPISGGINTNDQIRSSKDFYLYYDDNDEDIKSSDSFFISVLTESPELKNDPYLKNLNSVLERYENKKVLLKPDTNRSHANSLLKDMIDFCQHDDFVFESLNKNGEVEKFNLIDKSIKQSFYNFCYHNTSK